MLAVNQEEFEMSTKKIVKKSPKKNVKKVAKKATKKASKSKKSEEKKLVGPADVLLASDKKTVAEGNVGRGRSLETKAYFRELILEDKYTDTEIIEKVHARFPHIGLDKRYYVGWHRDQAKKAGLDVPKAIRVKKGTLTKIAPAA